jgi:uncharacterized damage-inducible protein DinB
MAASKTKTFCVGEPRMSSPSRTTNKATEFDVKQPLLETFEINERVNQKLIESLTDAAWRAATPTGKGRTIAGIACHIHNVRLMWLAAADKSMKLPAKLDDEKTSRGEAMEALGHSAGMMRKLLEKGLNDPAGRVPNFKPNAVAFTGYLIAHDAHHRGQIAMLAHQLNMAVPSKVSFSLWEWGTIWKECGFGS